MKINYPGSRFEPMTPEYLWTLRHPVALFNPQSLYHRIRAEIDHRRVFFQYLWDVRDEVGEILTPAGPHVVITGPPEPGGERPIPGPWVRQNDRVLQAAAGINDFLLDVREPNARVDAKISLPNMRDLAAGRFRLSAAGRALPKNRPAVLFIIDPDTASELCEAAGCDLRDIRESLRKALANAATGGSEEIAYTLAGVPSLFSSTNDDGRAEFQVDGMPAGHYMLPGDAFKVVCYAAV